MTTKLAATLVAIVFTLALAPMEVGAFTGGSTTSKPADINFEEGKKAVDGGDYGAAVTYLSKSVATNPNNADSQNLLGFSYRKLGDVDAAFKHYRAALAIDSKHRGANEYLGELYLEQGNLAKAEEHLKALDKACFFGCEEYSELKQEIASYKAAHGG